MDPEDGSYDSLMQYVKNYAVLPATYAKNLFPKTSTKSKVPWQWDDAAETDEYTDEYGDVLCNDPACECQVKEASLSQDTISAAQVEMEADSSTGITVAEAQSELAKLKKAMAEAKAAYPPPKVFPDDFSDVDGPLTGGKYFAAVAEFFEKNPPQKSKLSQILMDANAADVEYSYVNPPKKPAAGASYQVLADGTPVKTFYAGAWHPSDSDVFKKSDHLYTSVEINPSEAANGVSFTQEVDLAAPTVVQLPDGTDVYLPAGSAFRPAQPGDDPDVDD